MYYLLLLVATIYVTAITVQLTACASARRTDTEDETVVEAPELADHCAE